MNKEQQHEKMLNKIISSAIYEFNSNDYDSVSLNKICERGEFSKGIIYHYFKNKDELYLECVNICFDSFFKYFKDNFSEKTTLKTTVIEYLKIRFKFFEETPQLRGLFFYTILKSPQHLKKDIDKIKSDLKNLNLNIIKSKLAKSNLKSFLTLEEAVSFLEIQLNSMNEYFIEEARNTSNFDDIIEKHELFIRKWLNIIFYGILDEEYCQNNIEEVIDYDDN